MQVSTAKNFPSRYDIGDVVYFHPAISRFTLEEARQYAIMSRVASVSFRSGKVTYELAINVGANGVIEFYDTIPVADVDSLFVSSEDDLQAIEIVRGNDIGSSGEMVGLSSSIEEKLKRLCGRRCPEDPEAEMARLEKMAGEYLQGYQAMSSSDKRKAADRFSAIKNVNVCP